MWDVVGGFATLLGVVGIVRIIAVIIIFVQDLVNDVTGGT